MHSLLGYLRQGHHALKHSVNSRRWKSQVDLDGQGFPIEVIDQQ
jgi:hypothetical protein